MEKNLIKDLSKLTTIPIDSLCLLSNKAIWCICDEVEDTILNGETITTIDIGIGNILIKNEEDEVKYKFIPSKELENNIIDTTINKKNPLKIIIEKTLINKILNTYKDVL